MASNIWFIFASILLVSVGASRFDQGPQQFYDVSYDSETAAQNENKEIIVYLTPEQVMALESEGAVVKSADESNEDKDEVEPEIPLAPVTEEQEEEEDNTSTEEDDTQEVQQEDTEATSEDQGEGVDFEAILRLLNEEQADEEETEEEPAPIEPVNEEEVTEKPRKFSPKVTLKQQEQPQKEQTSTVSPKREQVLKTYSYIRYQPNEQPQRINIQLLQQASEPETTQKPEIEQEASSPAPVQEKKKYKLVPVEVDETSEEPAQEDNVQLQNLEPEVPEVPVVPIATDNKALNDDLKNILRELKASSKYNSQKYAIQVERLRNLEKVRALAKANDITKTVPTLIQQQLNKKILNKKKQGKLPAADSKETKSSLQKVSAENQKTIAIPVLDLPQPGPKTIAVPVEIPKVVSVKNVYVKTRTEKPYIISRRIPENKKLNLDEAQKTKPEKITILRHIWEQ